MGSEGSSHMVWGECSANVRTQGSPRKQLLYSEQLPLLERRALPEERAGKGGGRERWAEEREANKKSQPPPRALLHPPTHQGTAAPRAAPWIMEMMRPCSLGQLPCIL